MRKRFSLAFSNSAMGLKIRLSSQSINNVCMSNWTKLLSEIKIKINVPNFGSEIVKFTHLNIRNTYSRLPNDWYSSFYLIWKTRSLRFQNISDFFQSAWVQFSKIYTPVLKLRIKTVTFPKFKYLKLVISMKCFLKFRRRMRQLHYRYLQMAQITNWGNFSSGSKLKQKFVRRMSWRTRLWAQTSANLFLAWIHFWNDFYGIRIKM